VRPEAPLDDEGIASLSTTLRPPNVCLKIVPSPVEGEGCSIAQLAASVGSTHITELWQATGAIYFDTPSILDPWHKLTVKRVMGSYFSRYDTVLTYGIRT
jgi:hypothetical protein